MKLTLSILVLFVSIICLAQTIPEIELLIEKELESNSIPALAVAVIDSGKVVHISVDGFRDLENEIKAEINTSFHIASVSKIVTNLAIFILVESMQIDLESDINKYLPFEVINPHYPNDKITMRELLNHRSGIKDDYEFYEQFWNEPKGDPKIELNIFLYDYLNVNGKYYKKEHFESEPNYKSFSYSNSGVALLGLIVENISNVSYEEFCQQNIFKPLDMNKTSWFLKNLNINQVAKTYTYNDSLGFEFHGYNGYPDYPAGQLRTSISDYSKMLTSYLNSENSKFILNKKTTDKITPIPQISQNGFYTWFLESINNNIYYSHSGGDVGVSTTIVIDVTNKNGIVIFANSEHELEPLLRAIETEMWSH